MLKIILIKRNKEIILEMQAELRAGTRATKHLFYIRFIAAKSPHVFINFKKAEYEGHFRSNVNAIILAYSILFTSKAVYHRKRQPQGVRIELISMMHNSRMRVRTC